MEGDNRRNVNISNDHTLLVF